jgi:hypothetical protein
MAGVRGPTGEIPKMAFTLDQVVPWGRSFDEYVAMFSLSVEDLSQDLPILIAF